MINKYGKKDTYKYIEGNNQIDKLADKVKQQKDIKYNKFIKIS